jgi:hypothetical protein
MPQTNLGSYGFSFILDAITIVRPVTVECWHRKGFGAFWRWKSRKRAGRPKIDRGLGDLIQRMSRENPRWGASRIHGELLMLGFEVAQSTVSKYMARRPKPPSQTWKTFLKNHAKAIAAIDMCVVPALTFEGTSNNCHQSSGAPNLPTNDSALFSFRFCAVHPKDVRDCQLRQLFEVPLILSHLLRQNFVE